MDDMYLLFVTQFMRLSGFWLREYRHFLLPPAGSQQKRPLRGLLFLQKEKEGSLLKGSSEDKKANGIVVFPMLPYFLWLTTFGILL